MRVSKFTLQLFILFIFAYTVTSQTNDFKKAKDILLIGDDRDWGIKSGGGMNGTWEVGIIRCCAEDLDLPIAMFSYGVSNEFVYDGRLFNPKIHVQYTFLLAGARISLIDYNNSSSHELRLRPEIGFSYCGIIDVFFGHDFKLNEQDYNSVPLNRWYLSLNFPIHHF